MSILLYGCNAWTLTTRIEKKLDTTFIKQILRVTSHKIPAVRTRHAGHCWRSKDDLKSDVFLRTPSHGQPSIGPSATTYPQQLCTDTGCSLEDLLEAMADRDEFRETGKSVLVSQQDEMIMLMLYTQLF